MACHSHSKGWLVTYVEMRELFGVLGFEGVRVVFPHADVSLEYDEESALFEDKGISSCVFITDKKQSPQVTVGSRKMISTKDTRGVPSTRRGKMDNTWFLSDDLGHNIDVEIITDDGVAELPSTLIHSSQQRDAD